LGRFHITFSSINISKIYKSSEKCIYDMDCNVSGCISILLIMAYSCVSCDKLISCLHRHLHLELRKISRKIDLIFGTQMTMEMGCYFAYIVLGSQDIFNMIFDIKNFRNKKHLLIIVPLWLFLNIFRFFLINYACERVNIKVSIFKKAFI